MRVAFVLPDPSMPRTQFYHSFRAAATRNRRFADFIDKSTIIFSSEECSPELNWPNFGSPSSNFVRGGFYDADCSRYPDYTHSFARARGKKCILNMQSGNDMVLLCGIRDDIIVADINMIVPHRAANINSVSMPTLTIAHENTSVIGARSLLASFQGAPSHPCRERLASLHNGRDVICKLLDRHDYMGDVGTVSDRAKAEYQSLMRRSIFALVPRGDANFSYRLLEAMSFGCIPVVFSDDWILPFDRTVDWSRICIRYPESEIEHTIRKLREIDLREVFEMQTAVEDVYNMKFRSIDQIAEGLFQELELFFC